MAAMPMMDTRPSTIPGLAQGQAFIMLRYIFIAAALYLVVVEAGFVMPPTRVLLLFVLALGSNLLPTLMPRLQERFGHFKTALILGDTLWITLALVWTGRFGSDFVYLYFFVLLLAAIGENLSLVAIGAVIVCLAYGYWMSAQGGEWSLWNSPSVIRLPFLFTAAAFYGYLADSMRREQRHAAIADTAATAKLELLATVSHELRTPMTAILGHIEMLDGPDTTAEQRRESTAVLRRNGAHLMRILGEVLDFSRIEAGNVDLEMEPVDLRILVDDVAATMRVRAAEKGIAFSVAYEGDAPPCHRTDATRVRQILMNLVGNAIKFTHDGSVQVVVATTAIDAGHDMVRFCVSDTGPGIRAEDVPKLFRPFSQVGDARSQRLGGTGLGLAICRRLAELLGGTVDVRSTVGAGSAFTLALPLARASLPRETKAPAAAETPIVSPTAPDAPARSHRVLIVDDMPDNQRLLAYYCRRAGAEVELASDGQAGMDQALRALEAGQPFAVILLDMRMPVMDGYTAASELRKAGYRHPIVALTACAMPADRAKCLDAGCDEFLAKPIDSDALFRLLRARLPGDTSGPIAERHEDGAGDLDAVTAQFVAGLRARAQALRRVLDRGDPCELARHAHQLKGTARSFGFPELGNAAAALDAALAAAHDAETWRREARRVIALCERHPDELT